MPDKTLSREQAAVNRDAIRHLRDWLDNRDITQRQLADGLGVSEPTVSKWLRGTQSMTLAQFTAIARVMNMEPHQLLVPVARADDAPLIAELAASVDDLDADALRHLIETAKLLRRAPGAE